MYKIKDYIVQKYSWFMVRLHKTNPKKYYRISNFVYKTKVASRRRNNG